MNGILGLFVRGRSFCIFLPGKFVDFGVFIRIQWSGGVCEPVSIELIRDLMLRAFS